MKPLASSPRLAAILLAAPLLASLPVAARGQSALLTLDRAVAIAVEQSPAVRKAAEGKNALLGRYVQERSAALPKVTATAAVGRTVSNASESIGAAETTDSLGAKLGVTQALFTWGRIPSAIRIAEFGLTSWEDDLRQARQAAGRDAATSFYDVLLARAFDDIANRMLAQRERHLAEVRRRLEAGTATEYDVLAAEVAVRSARPETIRSANAERMARERLGAVLDVPVPTDVEGTLEAPLPAVPTYDDALATALANRPELAAMARAIAIAEELVTLRAAGDKPRADFTADFGWQGLDVGAADGSGIGWSATVALSWPLFDGRQTKGLVAQARSQAASLRIDDGALRDAIGLQVRQTVGAAGEAVETIGALSGVVEQAERLLAMANQGYALGVKTSPEVEDAALNLSQARANLARARRDAAVAAVNLRWATGTL